MQVFRHEVFIERPINGVFTGVANVNTHPKWQAGLIETEAKDAWRRVGDRGAEVRRMWVRVQRVTGQ
jgi:hypothetical protein